MKSSIRMPLDAERLYRRNHDLNPGSSLRAGATMPMWVSMSITTLAFAMRASVSGSTPKSSSGEGTSRGAVSNATAAETRSR